MYKLNFLQNPNINSFELTKEIALEPLKSNILVEDFLKNFKEELNFKSLNTFLFTKDGFLSLMLKLRGTIQVSLGESQAIIEAAYEYKNLGFDIDFISINRDGQINYDEIKQSDYIFVSSYIMDTYIKIDLNRIKNISNAKIISNISSTLETKFVDIAILDSYKLTGFSFSSVILHNNIFEEQYSGSIDTTAIYLIKKSIDNFKPNSSYKNEFKSILNKEFEDNIYYFVNSDNTLPFTLHFGLKGIKARELIRTLSLGNIFVTNGEGCSLGLSKPSRILQEMGYKEFESRWALSLSFCEQLNSEDIIKIVKTISKKYRQIRALND